MLAEPSLIAANTGLGLGAQGCITKNKLSNVTDSITFQLDTWESGRYYALEF